MPEERDYVLGTHDEELERLALQHRVWRDLAIDAWRRAGLTAGHRVIDLGSGPGFASLDLAAMVGPSGRVYALERSRRFLDVLERAAAERRLDNVEPIAMDLQAPEWPNLAVDMVWSRWALSFVPNARDAVRRAVARLRPGGTFVAHEYGDYRSWRFAPRCRPFESFVDAVMAAWRASGGEPDLGLDLPGWLDSAGLRVVSVTPIIRVAEPGDPFYVWPRAFFASGLRRLVDIGAVDGTSAAGISRAVETHEREGARMITPMVMEIVARRW